MATVVISDKFGGNGTACDGSWDAMHTFGTRKAGGNFGKNKAGEKLDKGGRMHSKIGEALKSFYKEKNLNPCVTAIKITVIPSTWTVEYEVTIEESPDGNAYVGFNSWGGASGGYPTKKPPSGHAYSNYLTAKKEWVPSGALIADVIDFHFPGGFRQVFFQHTDPSYPNKPKSANAKTGTVGVKVGPSGSPKNLPEYSGVLVNTTSVTPGGSSVVGSTVDTNVASTTQSSAPPTQAGTVDGTSTNTGGKFDFVTLKECFISVPPRRGGSVPVFIYYPKSEIFEKESEKTESQFTFNLDDEKISGTHSGIKLASRIIDFDNKLFKLNNNSLDAQILNQTESPIKGWFKKYVKVFANSSYTDFNKLVGEVIVELESRSLLISSLNLFMYGESTSIDTPVMQQITNLANNIKTMTLMEPLPSQKLVDISSKIKAAGGKVYYTYNPSLFNIDLTDITMISDSGTYSFKNDNLGQGSVMFPRDPITGFTPSLVSNPIAVNSGLTTSFWQLDLPVSINKVGTSSWELNYGGNIITKPTLATGPTGSDVNLVPFLPGGSYSGYSPRGLIYSNGQLIHGGPKLPAGASTNLSLFRNFFGNISYEDKEWLFASTGTSSGTGSSASILSQELGVTFSFRHKGLKDNLIPFSYTKLSDDLIKSGAYVYDLSKDAEYNRNRAGGTASGWPDLIQQPPTLVVATGTSASGLSASGQTSSISLTASYTIRYLNLQNSQSNLDIETTPQLALQIFSYDIEAVVGKSANPSLISTQIPKIRGQFIFDVRYKGILKNDQLGEFKIIEKVEIDPFVPSTEDDLTGLDPSFLEEAFEGTDELQTTEEELEIEEQLRNQFIQPEPQPEPQNTTQQQQNTTQQQSTQAEIPNSGSATILPSTAGFSGTIGNEFNGVPYFAQWDSRWSTRIYGSKCSDSPTIKSSGCGPTSVSMAICYWAKKGHCSPTTPLEIADLFNANGGRVCGVGTGLGPASLASALKSKFGLILKATTESKIRGILEKKYPVIISGKAYGSKGNAYAVSGSKTSNTTKGHFVCLTGIDGSGRIRVNDPGYAAKSGVAAFEANTNPSVNMGSINQIYMLYPEKLGSPA